MNDEISHDDFVRAFDRAARTEDGRMIYLFCQKALCALNSGDGRGRALQALEGRRKFAAELMGLMAKGIRESGRPTDAAVTFTVPSPERVASPGGAKRRVTLNTAVPSYDNSGSSGSGAG